MVASITSSAVVERSAPWQANPPGGARGQSGATDLSDLVAPCGVAAALPSGGLQMRHTHPNARNVVTPLQSVLVMG